MDLKEIKNKIIEIEYNIAGCKRKLKEMEEERDNLRLDIKTHILSTQKDIEPEVLKSILRVEKIESLIS